MSLEQCRRYCQSQLRANRLGCEGGIHRSGGGYPGNRGSLGSRRLINYPPVTGVMPSEQQVTTLRERIAELERDPTPDGVPSLVAAYSELAAALRSSGCFAEALAVYDEVLERFSSMRDVGVREQVAWALCGKAETLFAIGEAEKAYGLLDDIKRGLEGESDVRLQGMALRARVRAAVAISRDQQYSEALALYEQILDDAPDDAAEAIQVPLAEALSNRAWTLSRLQRWEEALGTYAEFLRRFSESNSTAIRYQLATVLSGQAHALMEVGLDDAAVDVLERIEREFADDPLPGLRETLPRVLLIRAGGLIDRGQYAEAEGVLDEILSRYWNEATPRDRIATFGNKAMVCLLTRRAKEALALTDKALALPTPEDDKADHGARASLAYNRALALDELGRPDDARAELEKLIARHKNEADPAIRATVANAEEALSKLRG
jgi:tetratricopeptide (TPR) repeat protein